MPRRSKNGSTRSDDSRCLLSYFGGKAGLAKKIIGLLPDHHAYVEPFGGSAAVLLAKEPSPIEIYNDLNGELVNLFRVLRDRGSEFIEKLQLMPYSEEEFRLAVSCPEDADELDRAVATFVRFRQSFSGIGRNWGAEFIGDSKGRGITVPRWLSGIDQLLEIVRRLKLVQFFNRDALWLIDRVGGDPKTVIYCDPPYAHKTRTSGKEYDFEMSDEQHIQLIEKLIDCRASVVISGYASDLYDDRLSDWKKLVFPRWTSVHKGLRGPREEVVWIKESDWAKRKQFGLRLEERMQ